MKSMLLLNFISFLLLSFIIPQFLNSKYTKLSNHINKNISQTKLETYNIKKDNPFNQWKKIKYDDNKIKSLIEENGYPKSYNFREATKVVRPIKKQGNCDSCWSIGITTCLSHR